MSPNRERDATILRRAEAGESHGTIAADYGLPRQRISTIVMHERTRRALIASGRPIQGRQR